MHEFTILTQVPVPELRQISLLCRARLLLQIGDLDQALRDANDAIATLPDESAYVMRGHIYRSRGNHDACLAGYSRAIQLSPDSVDLLENRAEVYEMLGRLEEAEADRAAVAETNPVRDFLALLENEGVRLDCIPTVGQ
jgi:tetratricopeptide (TPR) repeat protein